MKTRDRILHTSLDLFNTCGEPNVTTLQIADELDISPGNLYYHFRNKSEIIQEVYGWYERDISELLEVSNQTEINLEDQWLFLHLIFETIGRYRFLYQDLVHVISRYDKLGTRFNRILARKLKASAHICHCLVDQGVMQASDREIKHLATSICMTASYWLSHQTVLKLAHQESEDVYNEGVYQVMSLVAPYLESEARQALQSLAQEYVSF